MSMIEYQIKQLENLKASINDNLSCKELRQHLQIIDDAISTIQDLSAKLADANMERSSAYYNSGWIPVEERLPETHMDCLVSGTYSGYMGMYGAWIKTGYIYGGEWWGDCCGGEVNAWMPLPEPYRKDV